MGSLWDILFGFKDHDLTLPFLCPSYPFIHARLFQAEVTSYLYPPLTIPSAESSVQQTPARWKMGATEGEQWRTNQISLRKDKHHFFFKVVSSRFLYRITQIISIL